MQLSLLTSSPDLVLIGYRVNLLLGTPAAVAAEARALGYDGIEFLPGPPGTVGVVEMDQALKGSDMVLTAVNSGRLVAEGLTLFHPEPRIRSRAQARLKDLLEFAGHFGAPVTLTDAWGSLPEGTAAGTGAALAEEILTELARFGATVGSPLLLGATDETEGSFICTVAEAVDWVRRINHPGPGLMVDTHQLARKEQSVMAGLQEALQLVRHLHLYDPDRLPPATTGESSLIWPAILATLREGGYDRAGSVCLAPSGDQRALARKTAAYLRSLISD